VSSTAFALVRAVRGPVVLITLGILFAIDQTQGIAFRRTWPVLFIVFGVMKLIERLLAPPLPPPPPYYPPAAGAPGPWSAPPPPPPAQGGWKS
jgi:hypothetical protein